MKLHMIYGKFHSKFYTKFQNEISSGAWVIYELRT